MDYQGIPLEETIELLRSIDDSAAVLFTDKYQSKEHKANMLRSESNLQRMRRMVAARRTARMVFATRSTHTERPAQWLVMLKKVYVKVCEKVVRERERNE